MAKGVDPLSPLGLPFPSFPEDWEPGGRQSCPHMTYKMDWPFNQAPSAASLAEEPT